MICNDESTNQINAWLEKGWPEYCIVILEEYYFQEFSVVDCSFVSCPTDSEAVFTFMPEFCIIIEEEF